MRTSCLDNGCGRKRAMSARVLLHGLVILAFCAYAPLAVTAAQPPATPAPLALSAKPTYDCATARAGSARILCLDPAGAKADWDLSAVYWAYLFSLPERARDAFRRSHAEWVRSIGQTCQLTADQPSYAPRQ